MKVKKGDTVKILSGKERGKRGKVARVFTAESRLIVEGVNLKKKHRRSRRADRKGEVILLPSPVSASSVAVVCPSCGKPTRIGFERDTAGKRMRMCKECKAKFA